MAAEKQPTHAELAVQISNIETHLKHAAAVMQERGKSMDALTHRLDAIDAKLTPISELYTAGKVGGSIFKWFVGVLAGIAGVVAFVWSAPK